MDPDVLEKCLIAFGVLAGLVFIFTITWILFKSVGALALIRAFSIIPYGIYGGIAIQNAFHDRYGSQGQLLSKHGSVWISQGLHGIVGIFLAIWTFASTVAAHRIKSRRHGFSSDWSDKRRSGGYFCIVLADLTFLSLLTAAVAMGSTYTPWLSSNCMEYQIRPSRQAQGVARRVRECEQSRAIQMMALVSIFMIGLQIILVSPIIFPPTVLRLPIFYIVRALRTRKLHDEPKDLWGDIEKADLIESEETPQVPSLKSLFRNDAIATRVAQHLHFNDVANVALASKQMRSAIFTSPSMNRSDRFEMLCENSCEDGKKAECWACAKVICDDCRAVQYLTFLPRTQDHLKSCFAVCNKCYILRPSSALPAPFAGSWNPQDLAAQHPRCPSSNTSWLRNRIVIVCAACAELDPDDVVGIRERREAKTLSVALKRRIRCARCEKALPKEKRRWWICGIGNHDCHWEGHDLGL